MTNSDSDTGDAPLTREAASRTREAPASRTDEARPGTGEAPAVAATGRARLTSPRTDAATERQRVVQREKDEFGGMRFWTAFFGWLTAAGMTVLLVAVIGAIAAVAGAQNFLTTSSGTQTAGIVSAILLFVVLLVAYYCGGYVAGRMARFSGLKQGVAVWLWGVIVAVVLGIGGTIAGAQANIAGQLGGSVPNLPFSPSTLTLAGVVSAIVALVVMLIGALLGGLAGMRYHRRVDRVGVEG